MRHFLIDSQLIQHTDPSVVEPLTPKVRVCHRCGGEKFGDFFVWWNPLILHWIVNPGLAVHEVLLGQRIPKDLFLCKKCPGITSQYAECPGCSRFHHVKIWDRCPFGNWLGLVCPDCGTSIPCHLNLTSRLVMLLLFPIRWVTRMLWGQQIRDRLQQRTVLSRQRYLEGKSAGKQIQARRASE